MDRAELYDSMATKAGQLREIQSRMDRNGKVWPAQATEAELRDATLTQALDRALAAGDEDDAAVFAAALARSAANAPPPGSADQGARPGPPGPTPLDEAIRTAEGAGDWAQSVRLKTAKVAEVRARNDFLDRNGIAR